MTPGLDITYRRHPHALDVNAVPFYVSNGEYQLLVFRLMLTLDNCYHQIAQLTLASRTGRECFHTALLGTISQLWGHRNAVSLSGVKFGYPQAKSTFIAVDHDAS